MFIVPNCFQFCIMQWGAAQQLTSSAAHQLGSSTGFTPEPITQQRRCVLGSTAECRCCHLHCMTDPAQPALVWSGYTGYRDTLYTPNTPQHPPGSQWLTHNNHEKTLGTGRGSRAGGKLTRPLSTQKRRHRCSPAATGRCHHNLGGAAWGLGLGSSILSI